MRGALVLVWGLTGCAMAAGSDPLSLSELKLRLNKASEQVQAQYRDAASAALTAYATALDRAETALRARGDLDAVLAARDERKRVQSENSVPSAPPSGTPPAIAAAQTQYHGLIKKAEEERRLRLDVLGKQYVVRLETLKKWLTAQNRIEEALRVRDEIARAQAQPLEPADAPRTPPSTNAPPDSTPPVPPPSLPIPASLPAASPTPAPAPAVTPPSGRAAPPDAACEDLARRLKEANGGSEVQVRRHSALDGKIAVLDLSRNPELRSLLPLRGLELSRLTLDECPAVASLDGLASAPLTFIWLGGCQKLRDLTPLKGAPVRVMRLKDCPLLSDVGPLADMPLTDLRIEACDGIDDFGALKGIRSLRQLAIHGAGRLSDLSPIAGLKLSRLSLQDCREVQDLTALRGMPLESLTLKGCIRVANLDALRGATLKELDLAGCAAIADLSPLEGMAIERLNIEGCAAIRSLAPVRRAPLTWISVRGCSQLGPAERDGLKRIEGLQTLVE